MPILQIYFLTLTEHESFILVRGPGHQAMTVRSHPAVRNRASAEGGAGCPEYLVLLLIDLFLGFA